MYIYIYIYICIYICMYIVYTCMCMYTHTIHPPPPSHMNTHKHTSMLWGATVSRIDKITGLFCRSLLQKRPII